MERKLANLVNRHIHSGMPSIVGSKCTFYHSGRIAVGNIGSGRIDELRHFVYKEYPQIIDGKKSIWGQSITIKHYKLTPKKFENILKIKNRGYIYHCNISLFCCNCFFKKQAKYR